MKKVLALVLASVMTLSLAACGGSDNALPVLMTVLSIRTTTMVC